MGTLSSDWSRRMKSLDHAPADEFGAGRDPVPPLTDISSDSAGNSNLCDSGGCASSAAPQPGAPRDEALRRWALAEAQDKEHTYYGMRPLQNGVLGETVAVATMLSCFTWVYVGPLLTVWSIWRVLAHQSLAALSFLALLAILAVAPVSPATGSYGHNYIWQSWRRYFRMRWVTPAAPYLHPGRHYMFMHFPHAVFPIGSWLSMGLSGNEHATGFPERTAGCVASVLLYLPGLRHVLLWMGCTSAGRETLMGLLPRRSAGIIPEGIAGVFKGASRDREQVYFSPRKGICRVALLTGTPIVPVFILGQSQVFTFWGPEKLSRRLRAAVGLWWGRSYIPLPHKTDIIMTLGRPLEVEQVADPSAEQVEELHARVAAAVQELYQRHRHLLPALDSKELKII